MSFKIGDIVTPRPAFVGNGYNFRITAISGEIFNHKNDKYELKRVEGMYNPIYGPFEYQNDILNRVEHIMWEEHELDDAYKYNPKPYDCGIARDAADSLAYAAQVMGVPTSQVNITGDLIQAHIPTPDKPQEIIHKGINSPTEQELNFFKTIVKGENNIMNILDLYKERKEKEIQKEYREEKQKIMEQDTIQSIIIEMQDQVNAILESEDLKGRLKVYEEELHTKETEEKLNELRLETDKKEQELSSTLDEIRALFEMTADYNERIKILKNYKILDKNGKLSV